MGVFAKKVGVLTHFSLQMALDSVIITNKVNGHLRFTRCRDEKRTESEGTMCVRGGLLHSFTRCRDEKRTES